MNGNNALSQMKLPQNRVVITKLVLFVTSAVLALLILGLWFYMASLKISVSSAMRQAAAMKVTPTPSPTPGMTGMMAGPGAANGTPSAGRGKRGMQGGSQTSGMTPSGSSPAMMAGNGQGMMNGGMPGGMPGGMSSGMRGRSGMMGGDGQGGMGGGVAQLPLPVEFASLLESRPLFGAIPKSGPPQANVSGILGDQALINGNWMKVGETNNGIKLVATMPEWVQVEIEGKQTTVSVYSELPISQIPDGPDSLRNPMAGSNMGNNMSNMPSNSTMMRKTGRMTGMTPAPISRGGILRSSGAGATVRGTMGGSMLVPSGGGATVTRVRPGGSNAMLPVERAGGMNPDGNPSDGSADSNSSFSPPNDGSQDQSGGDGSSGPAPAAGPGRAAKKKAAGGANANGGAPDTSIRKSISNQ